MSWFQKKKTDSAKSPRAITRVTAVDKASAVAKVSPCSGFMALHGTLHDRSLATRSLEARLKEAVFLQLAVAMATGDPGSEEAERLVLLHRKWLCLFWREGMYSKKAHLTLTNIYLAEPRFAGFYDRRVGDGATKFLRDAVEIALLRGGFLSLSVPSKEEKTLSKS